MANAEDIIKDGCVEIMIRSGTESDSFTKHRSDASTVTSSPQARTPEIEESTEDEHSYAFSQRRQAFEGKVKDHCYTSKNCEKTGVQKEHSYSLYRNYYHSLSDEDIYQSTEDSKFFMDPFCYQLPHYKSNDSALDVTGFDSISEKCLSSENINVKTVDVFTERCILAGKSDPDISKMTIQPSVNFEKSSSVPNRSPVPVNKERMIVDHNYSTTIRSPLHDHSYDMRLKKRNSFSSGVKRGRSVETIFHLALNSGQVSATDFTKSPFLDHTYQSIEMIKSGKRHMVVLRYSDLKENSESLSPQNSLEKWTQTFMHLNLDHTYERKDYSGILSAGKSSRRFRRSNSFTDFHPRSSDSEGVDHVKMEEECLSDSGTESLNGETPMITDQNEAANDHSYV